MRFVVAVWGREFTDTFLELALPSHLSDGNIPAIADAIHEYRIYTTFSDSLKITKSQAYCHLRDLVPVTIFPIDGIKVGNPHKAISECHIHAISASRHDGIHTVFPPPDAVFSEASFITMRRISETGCKIIMLASVRAVLETAAVLLKKYRSGVKLNISGGHLVGVGIDCLHPISKSLLWRSGGVRSNWPSHLYWKDGDDGILARCFHMHPLLVSPPPFHILLSSTIDGDLVEKVCLAENDIYVVDDSDDAMCLELSCGLKRCGRPTATGISEIAKWAKMNANPYHRMMSHRAIHLHRWKTRLRDSIEEESSHVMQEIDSCSCAPG